MKTVAVTGGIGSGKTTVTSYIRSKGYLVIDADAIAKEITSKDGKAIPFIIENFGKNFILPSGDLNRAMMRDYIFKNPDKKKVYEQGTTAVVVSEIDIIKDVAKKSGEEFIFFDIPLLFEVKKEGEYDIICTVTADKEIRMERIIKRDKTSQETAESIIYSQTREEYKISHSDFVIYNNGTLKELYKNVDTFLNNIRNI